MGLLQWGLSWTYLSLIGLGPRDPGSEGRVRHRVFSNNDSPAGARFSLKSSQKL